MTADPRSISREIDRLLDGRREGATICPSDVARSLAGADGRWRDLMERVREVAADRAQAGELSITRGGEPVDARRPGGPIRIGR